MSAPVGSSPDFKLEPASVPAPSLVQPPASASSAPSRSCKRRLFEDEDSGSDGPGVPQEEHDDDRVQFWRFRTSEKVVKWHDYDVCPGRRDLKRTDDAELSAAFEVGSEELLAFLETEKNNLCVFCFFTGYMPEPTLISDMVSKLNKEIKELTTKRQRLYDVEARLRERRFQPSNSGSLRVKSEAAADSGPVKSFTQ